MPTLGYLVKKPAVFAESSNVLLEELMAHPASVLMCISGDGEKTLAPPPAFARWGSQLLTTTHALDLVAPQAHGAAVQAFLNAVLTGVGAETVLSKDGSSSCLLTAFDRRDAFGCVVVVLSETDNVFEPRSSSDATVAARRCTSGLDSTGRRIWVDDDYERMLGYKREESEGRGSGTRVHPDDVERTLHAFAELLEAPGAVTRIRVRLKHKQGHYLWTELTRTNLLHTADGHILNEMIDVSAEMAAMRDLEEREALLAQLTDALPIGVLHLNRDGDVGLFNTRWAELVGSDPSDDLDACIRASFTNAAEILRRIGPALNQGQELSLRVQFQSPERGGRYGRLRLQPVQTDGAEVGTAGLLLTLDDITDSVDVEDNLNRLARTDHLTQTLNRLGVEEQLAVLLEESRVDIVPLQLMFFDLDNFKAINDRLGHSAGDAVLQRTVDIISECLRPGDVVGRLGGDEFVAGFRHMDVLQVEMIADRIRTSLFAKLQLKVSIGSSSARSDDTLKSLLARADTAMYIDKACEVESATTGS